MKYFKMGEEVVVHATMYSTYIKDKKKWMREPLVHPKKAFYVGYTYKQEGKVLDLKEEQNYLVDIKSIKVLRVKFADWGNDKFALLQDVRRIR